jgi:hypothetical protein
MAFLPASGISEPRGLILGMSEAARQRAIEAARTRAAQEAVARFFGLGGPSVTQ